MSKESDLTIPDDCKSCDAFGSKKFLNWGTCKTPEKGLLVPMPQRGEQGIMSLDVLKAHSKDWSSNTCSGGYNGFDDDNRSCRKCKTFGVENYNYIRNNSYLNLSQTWTKQNQYQL